MAIGSRSESLIFALTFVKKVNEKWLYKSILQSFYILAAQFIYSRRDKPVEPVEEYDYEDLKESSNSLLNHQLSEFDQGIVKVVCVFLSEND